MNNTSIEWADVTINPIVGCSNGCPYCYARRMAKRLVHQCKKCYSFKPHPHLERLDQLTPRQKPKRIFINSMWDWNDINVSIEWLFPIIDKMEECSQHTFLILSKFPSGYNRFVTYKFPKNVLIGATCDGDKAYNQIGNMASAMLFNRRFMSFEPLIGNVDETYLNDLLYIDWIIIGAESGNRKGKVPCNRAWVEDILEACRDFKKPVFMKDNLWKEGVYWKEELIQEFPKF